MGRRRPRPFLPLARRAAAVGTLAAAAASGGCYAYAPAAPGVLAPGARVRVALTDAGAASLAPTVGASVRGLEGAVVRTGGDTLVVRADRLLTTADVDVTWTGADVALPAAWRQGVERRRLDRKRTAALVGGGVALTTAVIVLVRRGGDAAGESGGGDPIRVTRREQR